MTVPPAGRRERRVLRAALMARAQRGDRDAYRELLLDIRGLLLRLLRRWTSDPSELEDLAQEVLASLHRARASYDPARPFEPWLAAIVRHVASRDLRRRLRRRSFEVLGDELPDAPAADPMLPSRVDEVLARLPPRQREALELLKLEGLSVEAAAARAGVSPGALRVRAHRAYRALRRLLGG